MNERLAVFAKEWNERVTCHCEANAMSRGNPLVGKIGLVAGLLHFVRNDG